MITYDVTVRITVDEARSPLEAALLGWEAIQRLRSPVVDVVTRGGPDAATAGRVDFDHLDHRSPTGREHRDRTGVYPRHPDCGAECDPEDHSDGEPTR